MRSYPKIIRKLHLCAGCDKKETGCTRTSAANMLDLQYVSDGVHMGVSTFANGPDVYRCWSEDQCCILPWGASDSKANACYAWDLWRVLYLPARQCSCWPSLRDNQPSETRHLRSFHQTFCHPTAQIWTQFTTNYRNAFCGTWYLSHSDGHNERTVPIVMARSIANARNGHISTFGLTSDVTIVFIDHDFLNVAKISASRMNEWKCNDLKCVQKPT